MGFDLLDLVVWNGVITYYCILKGKVPDDEMQIANDLETNAYCKNYEQKTKIKGK